jgi:DNA-binding transcriptional ArsR family regulator
MLGLTYSVVKRVINAQPYEEAANLLRMLAHPHRLAIVHGLSTRECNVTKMQECLGIPQSTVSNHLKDLKAAGIVEGRRNGNEVVYLVVSDKAKEIAALLIGPQMPFLEEFSNYQHSRNKGESNNG